MEWREEDFHDLSAGWQSAKKTGSDWDPVFPLSAMVLRLSGGA
jgi:hypothetical protein